MRLAVAILAGLTKLSYGHPHSAKPRLALCDFAESLCSNAKPLSLAMRSQCHRYAFASFFHAFAWFYGRNLKKYFHKPLAHDRKVCILAPVDVAVNEVEASYSCLAPLA